MKNLRSIEVKAVIPNIILGTKGYFHRWCYQPDYSVSMEYPLHKTVALVEFLDGSIKLMDPETIRFTEPHQNLPKAR